MIVHVTSRDGTSIGCMRYGSGRPLVLVHGTSGDHTRWAPLLSTLEQQFTVYACDRRGRGLSGDGADYSLEREAEDIVAVVEGIGGSVDLLGHSHGAIVALEAARRTTHIRHLVLYEPPIVTSEQFVPREFVASLQSLLAAGRREDLVIEFLEKGPRMPADQLARMRAMPAWQGRVAAAHTIPREIVATSDYRFDQDAMSTMRTPTLLLAGGASPPPFRAAIDALHRALGASRVVVMPGQQHVAMDTAPELFLRELLAFLTPG